MIDFWEWERNVFGCLVERLGLSKAIKHKCGCGDLEIFEKEKGYKFADNKVIILNILLFYFTFADDLFISSAASIWFVCFGTCGTLLERKIPCG